MNRKMTWLIAATIAVMAITIQWNDSGGRFANDAGFVATDRSGMSTVVAVPSHQAYAAISTAGTNMARDLGRTEGVGLQSAIKPTIPSLPVSKHFGPARWIHCTT